MHLIYLNFNKSLLKNLKHRLIKYRMNKIDMNDTIRSASCVFSLASPCLPALSRIYLWGSGGPLITTSSFFRDISRQIASQSQRD
jgi:hypothetical protein